jgi:hypothetical protein
LFDKTPEKGKRSVRKPRKRWFDNVENDTNKIGVKGRRKIAKDKKSRNWS